MRIVDIANHRPKTIRMITRIRKMTPPTCGPPELLRGPETSGAVPRRPWLVTTPLCQDRLARPQTVQAGDRSVGLGQDPAHDVGHGRHVGDAAGRLAYREIRTVGVEALDLPAD